MAKVVLEYVKNEDKTSSRNGNPYTSCSIKVRGRYYNGFGDEETKKWKKGDTVNVDLYEDEYNGKTQYKFSPMPLDETEKKLNEALQRITNIEKFLKKQFMSNVPKTPVAPQPPAESDETVNKVKEIFPGATEVPEEKKKGSSDPW